MSVNLVQSIQRIAAAVLESDKPACIRYATVECEEDTRGSSVDIRLSQNIVIKGFGSDYLINGSEYTSAVFDGGEMVTLLQDRGGQRFWILKVG